MYLLRLITLLKYRVIVPPTVTLPHIETALLIVRLFNVTAGKLAVPAPPNDNIGSCSTHKSSAVYLTIEC